MDCSLLIDALLTESSCIFGSYTRGIRVPIFFSSSLICARLIENQVGLGVEINIDIGVIHDGRIGMFVFLATSP